MVRPPNYESLGWPQMVLFDCLCFHMYGKEIEKLTQIAADFEAYLWDEHEKLISSGEPIDTWRLTDIEAGLVCYGHLDLIGNVIDALPSPRPRYPTGSCVVVKSIILDIVLPLPEDIKGTGRSWCDTDKVKAWYAENKERLRWNPETKKYYLE